MGCGMRVKEVFSVGCAQPAKPDLVPSSTELLPGPEWGDRGAVPEGNAAVSLPCDFPSKTIIFGESEKEKPQLGKECCFHYKPFSSWVFFNQVHAEC